MTTWLTEWSAVKSLLLLLHRRKLQVLQYKRLRIANGGPSDVVTRQIHKGLVITFFADHIRILTESFDSKISAEGNPLFRQLECTYAYQVLSEVPLCQPKRKDVRQASRRHPIRRPSRRILQYPIMLNNLA
jgi:hypothetical protein